MFYFQEHPKSDNKPDICKKICDEFEWCTGFFYAEYTFLDAVCEAVG